jgi:hypothetical protein
MAVVVARPNVQHPQRVPLGGLPAVWCSGARSRSLSTNTQVSWKMCSFVWPGWTGPSTDWRRCIHSFLVSDLQQVVKRHRKSLITSILERFLHT